MAYTVQLTFIQKNLGGGHSPLTTLDEIVIMLHQINLIWLRLMNILGIAIKVVLFSIQFYLYKYSGLSQIRTPWDQRLFRFVKHTKYSCSYLQALHTPGAHKHCNRLQFLTYMHIDFQFVQAGSLTCKHDKRLHLEILKIDYNLAFFYLISTKIES